LVINTNYPPIIVGHILALVRSARGPITQQLRFSRLVIWEERTNITGQTRQCYCITPLHIYWNSL